MQPLQVTVLGASGSIGVNTLDVIERHSDRYQVFALTAARSVETIKAQCLKHRPKFAVMTDDAAARQLRDALQSADVATEVLCGEDALADVAAHDEVDIVMAAIVGAAGMPSALAAARAGKRLLLANKEALVTAGGLFMDAVQAGQCALLPVDSEHNAIFQCLPSDGLARPQLDGVAGLVLTASGGPFRGREQSFLESVTPAQACAHPNWSMGRKISVDSASLMNKGLELAEACWLFGVDPAAVEVLVHPQSIIHSMVRYHDGSVLAQLGEPDMRTPIAACLAWPERIDAGVNMLDFVATGRLDFESPDEVKFPCLRIARECIVAGGGAMAVCNAANEEAVAEFLDGSIGFTEIPATIERTLAQMPLVEPTSLAEVEEIDARARALARESMARGTQVIGMAIT